MVMLHSGSKLGDKNRSERYPRSRSSLEMFVLCLGTTSRHFGHLRRSPRCLYEKLEAQSCSRPLLLPAPKLMPWKNAKLLICFTHDGKAAAVFSAQQWQKNTLFNTDSRILTHFKVIVLIWCSLCSVPLPTWGL